MLQKVEWGEFTFKSIFNKIKQGRRLKKDDQQSGDIPFVMAGVTNTGVVNYVSNPVAYFPKNSITIDIFGNVFYRDYAFGAGDDTGVYWNDKITYSKETMLFFAIAMRKSLEGQYSYGKKLRSSQSLHFKMSLPVKNNKIDFSFIDKFIAELEAERIAELEAYLLVTGLKDYKLTGEEQKALSDYDSLSFKNYSVPMLFDIKNTGNILSKDIVENSGEYPYLCASVDNNAVNTYISYDKKYMDRGNCIFIGGKTFVVTYQEKDFFSNDSHNLTLRLKDKSKRSKDIQLYIATCIKKSLGHKYSWGDSISSKKIKNDIVALPHLGEAPDYASMNLLISAIQKLVIKDVVLYADKRIDATKTIVNG